MLLCSFVETELGQQVAAHLSWREMADYHLKVILQVSLSDLVVLPSLVGSSFHFVTVSSGFFPEPEAPARALPRWRFGLVWPRTNPKRQRGRFPRWRGALRRFVRRYQGVVQTTGMLTVTAEGFLR